MDWRCRIPHKIIYDPEALSRYTLKSERAKLSTGKSVLLAEVKKNLSERIAKEPQA
jgi:hypothetical protein